jgi:6-phosphogluconolactonase
VTTRFDAGDPGEPEVRVLVDAEAVSVEAARVIAEALGRAVAERGRADWATTGGSTPLGIYRALAVPPLRDAVPWDRVHIWWGDDRFVPRDDPLSNVLACDQVLLGGAAFEGGSGMGGQGIELGLEPGVPIPLTNLHAMPCAAAIGEGRSQAWTAEEYERELRGAGLAVDDAGYPRFDVLLLGLGSDGHLMSVFPGSSAFDEDAWVLPIPAPTHIAPRVPRITLNPRVVPAARLTLMVVHGDRKAEIVARVLEGERSVRDLPSQLARRAGALWLLDAAAAADLTTGAGRPAVDARAG